MYLGKFVIDYEKKYGVEVVYCKTCENKSFRIPLSWARVSKNKEGYLKKGYIIIHRSGVGKNETFNRHLMRSEESYIPLVLKNLKVAKELARLHGGIVVKICKNTS